jgi:hypothetical protein
MEIDALYATRYLVEADVVEALETRPVDRLHSVIRDEEVLFPAHEEVLFLHPVLRYQLGSRRVFGKRLVCWKSGPVLSVDLFVRTPLGMLCDERVLAADDLALEVCGETRMIFR